jgi:hypothetical protein
MAALEKCRCILVVGKTTGRRSYWGPSVESLIGTQLEALAVSFNLKSDITVKTDTTKLIFWGW